MSQKMEDVIDALEATCKRFEGTEDRQAKALLMGVLGLVEHGKASLPSKAKVE